MKTPKLIVESVRKIFDDGNHNAFTDMVRFNDRMFLCFRSSPTGHDVVDDSSIVVLTSENGDEWRKIHSFSVPGRDVRDPHFLIFRERLFVYSGTWLCDGNNNLADHLGFAAWTDDGDVWNGPRELAGTHGYYVWRAASYDDTAYLCGQWRRHVAVPGDPKGKKVARTALLASDDGFEWREIGQFEGKNGNETAFLFEDDGEIVAVSRDATDSKLCRSRPPYQQWTRKGLGRFVGGPLLVKWNDHYLFGGRKLDPDKGPKTVLSWLIDDQLVDVAELPSGGDNSYPGFIQTDGNHASLSYYSSHEGSNSKVAPCSIYLANLRMEE